MAYYLVRAKISKRNVPALGAMLDNKMFVNMEPFGKALTKGLRGMRWLPDGRVAWEEEDYCTPALRMEREAVLDGFFTKLEVEKVQEGEGWKQIKDLPLVFGGAS